MKELKKIDDVYLSEYDIHVSPYLTYAQIQQIVNAVQKLDAWAERQQSIDMLVLYHATDIGKDAIEAAGHDAFLESGLIDAVITAIKNVGDIYVALEYTESVQRFLVSLSRELPKYLNTTKPTKTVKKNGKSNKKQ